MENIKMDFWGEVKIEKMFDIHDNQKVIICTNTKECDNAEQKEESETTIGEPAIPQECKEAANQVLTYQFTNPKGAVLNSRKQIIKAAMKISVTSNVQLAMFMKICMEVEAIHPATSCPDFVRALIGIGSIEYSDEKAISRMAGGMAKKMNGHKSKGKTYPPLDKNHLCWKAADREIGNHIYENMNSEED